MPVWSQIPPAANMAPTVLLVVLVVAGGYVRWLRSAKLQLPPGPAALPLLGNVHQLPTTYQQRTMAEWGKQYGSCLLYRRHFLAGITDDSSTGEVVFAKFFRTPALVLSSKAAAIELMEKRSGKYSSRPPFILLKEL